MLPIRHKSIFKSRWTALLWAGGILWSACEFVGGQPGGATASANQSDPTSDAASAAAIQAAANALGAN